MFVFCPNIFLFISKTESIQFLQNQVLERGQWDSMSFGIWKPESSPKSYPQSQDTSGQRERESPKEAFRSAYLDPYNEQLAAEQWGGFKNLRGLFGFCKKKQRCSPG